MEFLFSTLQSPIPKVGCDDVKYAVTNPHKCIIINTLPVTEQSILIKTTIPYDTEESRINELLKNYDTATYNIIVYGKNAADNSVEKKYRQLKQLGFSHVYVYSGGLFEWVLLQELYDVTHFSTTAPPSNNLLGYSPRPFFDKETNYQP